MPLLRVRRAAQLTLPAEIRRALKLKPGDYLEATIVKDGILLKPVSVVQRAKAWSDIVNVKASVRAVKPFRGTTRGQERSIAREVKRMRRGNG